MEKRIKNILSYLKLGEDNIFSYEFTNIEQDEERKLRESVASQDYQDYLDKISNHHSIPVMDREVDLFLKKTPPYRIIVDVGGCWGWHWRRMKYIRPDVFVFIVDFVRENLIHARDILGSQINKNIFLIHGDATDLIFEDNTFDGWWSVQTLQHIPNFEKAVKEAWRVLNPGGIFANYSLNIQSLVRFVYRVMGKHYHITGQIPGTFYLSRASDEQLKTVEEIFSNDVQQRFTEILFHPDFKITSPGKENSISGGFDALFFSSNSRVFSSIARQQSFHTCKIG